MRKTPCVYCGQVSTTKDHTPPRNLLLKPLPSHVVTVPACETCNNGFSFDESVFKLVLAHSSGHPVLREALEPGGVLHRALARDSRLRRIYEDSLDGERLLLSGEIWNATCRVLIKTVQGLYWATFGRFVPAHELQVICFQDRRFCSLEQLVDDVRPPQVLDITDDPLPEITPSGWARKGQLVAVQTTLSPLSGDGEQVLVNKVFWLKQETPIEWIDYQPGIFFFGFVGTEQHKCICALELWQTLTIGISAPWPSGRGTLRRGRRNLFSRERTKDA